MERALLIGLDTNVLVRLVMEDDEGQIEKAQGFFNGLTTRDPAYLSILVLCEFAWTLGRFYKLTRDQVAVAIEQVLNMPSLQIERPHIVRKALQYFRASRADFGDCCIGVLAETAGCVYTVTFDRDASKLPGMHLLGEAGA